MIIEFIGRPGSGKSTIAVELHKALAVGLGEGLVRPQPRRGLLRRIVSRSQLDYFSSRLELRVRFSSHPYVAEGVLTDYLRAMSQVELDRQVSRTRKRMLLRDLIRHLVVQDCSSGLLHVFDEGVAHRGVSASLSGFPDQLLERHYCFMPLADFYVYVDAPDSCVSERLQKRDGSKKKFISTGHYNLVRSLLGQRGVRILDVDGSQAVSESVAKITMGIPELGNATTSQGGSL